MTTSAKPRHAWVDVYDLEDTVTFHVPGEAATVRLLTTPRDTDAAITERLSFGVVGSRPEQPIGVTRQRIYPPCDPVQQRFDRFAAGVHHGRHRAPEPAVRPGLLARLARALRLGRRDGA